MSDIYLDEYGMVIKTELGSDGGTKIYTLDRRLGTLPRLLINGQISEHGLVTVFVMSGDNTLRIETSYIGYLETQPLCSGKIPILGGQHYLSGISESLDTTVSGT